MTHKINSNSQSKSTEQKPAQASSKAGEFFSGDLVPSISIANLVNQRAAVVERLRAVLELLAEAEQLAGAAHLGFPRLVIDNSYSRRGSVAVTSEYADSRKEVEDHLLHTVDAKGWQYLMSETGLRTFMDASTRAAWDEQIHKGDVPELTAANVEATFAQLYGARGEMFERGVVECFRGLSWNYKTNTPCRFGKRIIVNYLLSSGFVNHHKADKLDDLMRVMCVLDGQPEPDHRNGMYALISDVCMQRMKRDGVTPNREAENAYLHVRWFLNGNGHVTFKRPDLVDRMNDILAKHYPNALPPAR